MSLFLTIPISGQGIITDVAAAKSLPSLMGDPFAITDVFLYSHGWWTTAEAAMIDYNNFSLGVARSVFALSPGPGRPKGTSLGVGLHWPSSVSEDSRSILNVLQPLSFFNRAEMADIVGAGGAAALLRLILQGRRSNGMPPPRLHLIGHSFGCKVVCSALQALASSGLLDGLTVNVALIQGAFDFDELEPGQSYGDIESKVPQARFLVTHSDLDLAVKDAYVAAGRFKLFSEPKQGLGFAGPSLATRTAFGATDLAVGLGFAPTPAAGLGGRMVVANLTPLHASDGFQTDDPLSMKFSGHHSDIFHKEIYQLITGFMFPG
jgi:hypothetical protein